MALTRWEMHWADVIGRTLIPKGVQGGVIDNVSPSERLVDEARLSPKPVAFLYRIALVMVWFAPLFVVRRLCTFGSLNEDDRVRVFEALLAAKNYEIRMIATVLKITFCASMLSERSLLLRLNAYGLAETPMPSPSPEGVKVSP